MNVHDKWGVAPTRSLEWRFEAKHRPRMPHKLICLDWYLTFEKDKKPNVEELQQLFHITGLKFDNIYHDGVHQALSSATGIFTARYDGRLLGFARVHNDDAGHRLGELVVHQHYQRRGIGKSLLSMAEQRAKDDGGKLLYLQATAESKSYYEERGYQLTWNGLYAKYFHQSF